MDFEVCISMIHSVIEACYLFYVLQQEEANKTLMEWYREATGQHYVDYVLDVWLPEVRQHTTANSQHHTLYSALSLPMLRLLPSKAQERKDF